MIAPMNLTDHRAALSLAETIAAYAAEVARRPPRPDEMRRKPDHSVVTDADCKIQRYAMETIRETFPDHAVLGEESVEAIPDAPKPANTRFCWVIDPIDGTRNYVTGFPCVATSIALLEEGRPVVALVAEHAAGRSYTAIIGQGTALDGIPQRIDEPGDDADILVGIPSSKDRLTRSVVAHWQATKGIISRNLGSTATHLALVASNGLAATFCKKCKIWDIVAGVLLITEAGGVVTDPLGADRSRFDLTADPEEDVPVLAAAPRAHQRLLESIAGISEPRP